MSRIVKLSALNIVTHPHSPAGYAELFRNARDLRQSISVWGETHAFLATAYQMQEGVETSVITGEIFTFLQLDPSLAWFDIVRGEQATEDQAEEVVIPENLRPHLKRVRYAFFPENHMFVFVTEDSALGRLSVSRAQEFLIKLLNDNRLLQNVRYQEVEVRLVQDKRDLDAALSNITLEMLEIVIKKPNAGDTPGDADAQVESEMSVEKLKELRIIKKAATSEGIQPNARTKQYMQAATTNGHVIATGKDEKEIKRVYNTQSSPMIEPYEFRLESGYLNRFLDVARDLLGKIKPSP